MKLVKRSAAALIVALALGTAGCASVGGFFGDAAITHKVKSAISSEPELKVTSISVSTEGSVVTLSGTVKSRAERARAIQVARKVEGVKAVRSELTVQP